MFRSHRKDGTSQVKPAFSADDIEQVIYDNYPNRDSYLDKIARVAMHLSLHTRIGRISWTFQDAIFNDRPRKYQTTDKDYLEWLMTTATNEEVFPELFASGDSIKPADREQFVGYMKLEQTALLNGLQEIVRKCCDSKVCSVDEYNTAYDEILFKSGTVFNTAAKSLCIMRRIDDWSPPPPTISIPNTEPAIQRISASSLPEEDLGNVDYDELTDLEYNELLKERTLVRQKSFAEASVPDVDLKRNYGLTSQLTCLNADNLIHNLAVLAPGRMLELPWNGQLLDSELQNDIMARFRVEISLRRFYLASLREGLPSLRSGGSLSL